MTRWQPRLLKEAALQQADERLAASPEAIETRFERACLLAELGRTEEAKAAYLALLKEAPTHFGVLINFGTLVWGQGFRSAARTLYTQAVTQHPDNPKGHVNLANLLVTTGEVELAMQHFETALRLDPDHVEANRGMAYLLIELRDEARAAPYLKKARRNPVLALPYWGEGEPVRVLLLVSAAGGTIPMRHHFDERVFLVSALFVEFYDPAMPLPPHQLVVNAVGDADLCHSALEAAALVLTHTSAPVINPPSRVLPTGRVENARRLAFIPGVIAPKMALLPRKRLEGPDAASELARQGFTFPLLLRAPGFHTGKFFVRVDTAGGLAAGLDSVPGEEVFVIQFIDARSPDGKIRKYRVMMIDGMLYPLHMAIAHDWKVHYFTAEMADNAAHRAEDGAFINNMPEALGPRALQALANINRALGLDYGGIDFSLSAEGDVILFEANATMVVYPPDKDPRWDYRRPAVQCVLDAVRRLLTRHVAALPPIERLITDGGDARIRCGENGLNKYGCPPMPDPGMLSFSSSTASAVSSSGFAQAGKLYARLAKSSRVEAPSITYTRETNRLRRELLALSSPDSLPGTEVVFAPSGTDLHLLVPQLLCEGDKPLLVIMSEASETGSGVSHALEGRHYSSCTAYGGAVTAGEAIPGAAATEVVAIPSRRADGSLRAEAEVDREVEARVEQALTGGQRALLILTDVSKTGLITPSVACAVRLRTRFADKVDVLVDACQFRLSPSALRAYLEEGFLVAVTGSKFVTGPAFCAALLVPRAAAGRLRARPLAAAFSAYSARADWPPAWEARAALSDNASFGLLLRLEAAFTELRAFRALPEDRLLALAEAFAQAVEERIRKDNCFELAPIRKPDRGSLAKGRDWDNVPTIFPFLLRHPKTGARFTHEETVSLYEKMKQDMGEHLLIPASLREVAARRYLLGQPVACGTREGAPVSALRLNMDMRLMVDALSPQGRGTEAVIADALSALDKAALLAQHLF